MTTPTPTVSVIIPTHNRSGLVRAAIDSVLSQTYQDFEILVVDDASTDDTERVLRSIQDSRIRYVRHDLSRGDAAARNSGLRQARGRYVAFLDDDDQWLSEKLDLQVTFVENAGLECAGVHTARLNIDAADGSARLEPSRGDGWTDLTANSITTSSVLLRKHCFDVLGLFDEAFPFNSDYDMWIRIGQTSRIGYLSRPLVKYRIHASGPSTNWSLHAMIRGRVLLLQKHRAFFSNASRRAQSQQYLYLGTLYCYVSDISSGRRAYWQALRLNPLSLGCYFNLALSFFGPSNYRRLKEFKRKLVGQAR